MRLFVLAGEASGDKLGAALMSGLRAIAPDVAFAGVGGPLMQEQGLVSQFPMGELSLMGLVEILPRYLHLRRRIREVAAAVLASDAQALITIDSPDFSLRVARLVKNKRPDFKTIHYVAPTVWAWRPGRARHMAQVIDHVLALFPFEPPYMQAAGMSCDFTGHPVVSEQQATAGDSAAFRRANGLAADTPLILALPGSRRGEVARLLPVFGAALTAMIAQYPAARVVVPAVAHVADTVIAGVRNWPGDPIVLDPRNSPASQSEALKRSAFKASDVALAASGTVSLELAAAGTPMVIAYDFQRLTRWIMQKMLRIDTVTLVNLVSETRAVPEFLGKDCQPADIAVAALKLMQDGPARLAQTSAAALTMQRLGQGAEPPGLRAARSVLRFVSPAR